VLLSRNDLADLDRRVELAVARLTSRVLTATNLLNDELRSLFDADHLGRYRGTFDSGSTDGSSVIVTNDEHLVELQFVTFRRLAIVDLELLTFFYFELTTAVGNDGVHAANTVRATGKDERNTHDPGQAPDAHPRDTL